MPNVPDIACIMPVLKGLSCNDVHLTTCRLFLNG